MTPPSHDDLASHIDALRRLARELVGGEGPWEDLVQGTYLAALERPPRLLSRAWLARVLRNRAYDFHRKQGSTATRNLSASAEQALSGGPDGAEIAQRLEIHGALLEAVRSLEEPYRAALFLRYFEDLGPTDIAQRLGLPVKTVKTRLVRGLALLRERLCSSLGEGREGWLSALLPLAFPAHGTPLALSGAPSTLTGIGLMLKKVAIACVLLIGIIGLVQLNSGTDGVSSTPGLDHEAVGDLPAKIELETPVVGGGQDRKAESIELGGDEAAAPSNATTAELVVSVVEESGEPGLGACVGLRTRSRLQPARGVALRTVVESAPIRFRDLKPGSYRITCSRARSADIELEAGEVKTIELRLRPGVSVRGRVVDSRGNPVVGASLWQTTEQQDWMGGSVVGASDADGSFELRHVPSSESLGALAPRYSPSQLIDLETLDLSVQPVEIELVLAGVGGGLAGVVLDPEGEPVADALVAIGERPIHAPMRITGGWPEFWTPRSMRTDAEGRFRFFGIEPGATRVCVRADSYPILQTEVLVSAGADASCELFLTDGATLSGRVLDAQGMPIVGAVVRAFDHSPSNLGDDYVDRGQFDYGGTFAYPSAIADEQGQYSLTLLNPGPVRVFANPPIEQEVQPYAQEILQLVAGAEHTWDPVLGFGLSIEGSLTYLGGAPIPEQFILARNSRSREFFSAPTDEQGRFQLIHLEDVPHSVWVQDSRELPEDLFEPIALQNVRPGGAELNLVASGEAPVELEIAKVHAKIDDRAERLGPGAGAMLAEPGANSFLPGQLSAGEVRFDYVYPGSYRLFLLSDFTVSYASEVFEVQPGEDLDLGTLVTEPAAVAHVLLQRGEGTARCAVQLGAQATGAMWASSDVGTVEEHLIENLSAGDFLLHVSGAGIASQKIPFQLEAGQTTTVEVLLAAAVKRRIEIHKPADASYNRIRLVLEHDDGRVYEEWDLATQALGGNPIAVERKLPLGEYVIRVLASGGAEGRAEFVMESLAPDQAPVVVQLK